MRGRHNFTFKPQSRLKIVLGRENKRERGTQKVRDVKVVLFGGKKDGQKLMFGKSDQKSEEGCFVKVVKYR